MKSPPVSDRQAQAQTGDATAVSQALERNSAKVTKSIDALTVSLDKAAKSSSWLGWVLIFVTIVWILVTAGLGLPAAIKGYREILGF